MQRTQIYREPELAESLDRLAERRRTSRAALIRDAARADVSQESTGQDDPIFGIIGLGHGSAGDVSEYHDEYLAAVEVAKWRS